MLARGQAAPLRFLVAVLLLWVTGRGVVIEGWNPLVAAPARLGPSPGWLMARWPAPPAHVTAGTRTIAGAVARPVPPAVRHSRSPDAAIAVPASPARVVVAIGTDRPASVRNYARSTGIVDTATIAGTPSAQPAPRSRWSGSAWAFVRGGGRARPLSSDGQIGGGQTGARVLYRLDDTGALAASARLSGTIGGPRQTEAAVGIDWRPVAAIPIHLTAERRIAIDRGGRDAFTLGAAGGVYDLRPAEGWRLDGYGEAGVVGARRRDLYVDGAVRAGREFDLGDHATLTLGAGVWGAAQPHAARLDAGPSAVVRMPVAERTVAVALDYRARLAGDARPHSGVALTVGVDF